MTGHSYLALAALLSTASAAVAGQAPFAATAADVPISGHDRVYAAEQFSNTVSVVDPSTNRLLGVIRLGEPQPANFSPLYRGQVLVHGMGFSPDRRTIAVVSIGSNSVTFIDTATNAVKHTTYIGRSPHEAFFTPDGREVWVTVRGEDYVSVLDAESYAEIARVKTPGGPGMTIFSPDGQYAYVCSSFNPELVVFDVRTRAEVGRVAQPSPFCPNLAATPDGRQVWYTLKDIGKTVVIDAKPPFATLKVIDTGPITNHVNFVDTAHGHFAYVTVGGRNEVQVFRRDTFARVATVAVGKLPHGIWPSGDGTRVYVGLENDDRLVAIDTASNTVVATIPIGQAAQAVNYVPNAVPSGDGITGLEPLGVAGGATHLTLGRPGRGGSEPTSVSLFDQGLVQILEAAVTGLSPRMPYILGLAANADGSGKVEPLASFVTNPAGAAIVNATGPIRTLVRPDTASSRRYLVIVAGAPGGRGIPVQIQQN
ncbi:MULTISPECIES: YncE family protein [Sphingosinicellaceae]|uniref:YncE family protein n=1 Tax=Sphingosinicellaceae TaxID=2820280 RepID=UPI001C1E74C3|nr:MULTISPECIES: YncE family protein [Polymorphobacter]QYE33415.1 beta-propeller fold lactonase family protein [Polymorphobacter sp. PAMC 29334]UAJ12525.1 beta-propeller fold lactonase family protein [Polymorphobacter megasporae]